MIKYAAMTFMFESWCLAQPTGHEHMVEGFAQLGLEAIEPFHTWFVDHPDLIKRYRTALADNNMRVSAVDVICDLVYSSPQEQQQGLDALRRGLELCAIFGAEVAHVAGHMPKEGVALSDARKMITEQLMGELDFARKNGITLAIEDFGLAPTLLCKAEHCLEVLNSSGGAIRFVFDVGNFEFADEHADANLDALYEHICYVHFKDVCPAADRKEGNMDFGHNLVGCPLGEGLVPAAEVAGRLKERNYDGWIALECGSLLDTPMATVQRDLDSLKGWLE